MNRKLVFLDIDGTLTVAGSNVPPQSALAAVRTAQANGHRVLLCSGRNYDMLAPLREYGFDGVIASSGGYIVCDGQVIFDHPMTMEQRDRAMRIMNANAMFLTIEGKHGSFTDEGFKDYIRKHTAEGANSEFLRWREAINKELNIRPMEEYQDEPIYKMVFMATSQKGLDRARELMPDYTWYVQDPDGFGILNGELVTNDFNKGKAVRLVSEHYGIPIEDTIAFGDSANDLEMVDTAGVGVCMGNGGASVKARADYVCPAVDEDGLKKGFEHLGLL